MSLDLLEKIFSHSSTRESGNSNQFEPSEISQPAQTARDTGRIIDPYAIFQPLPPYSTILGICEDGLPLLLDLSDPNPGAILIAGSKQNDLSRLLTSILWSACELNSSDQLNFYLITPNPGINQHIGRLENCYGMYSSYDRASCELIIDLAALVEQRRSGRHTGAKCILAIENLYELIKNQEFEVLNHLKWLFKFGANNGVWVISTLESNRFDLIDADLLREQKTQIEAGSVRQSLPYSSGDGYQNSVPQCYRTQIGSQWVDFWLPSM